MVYTASCRTTVARSEYKAVSAGLKSIYRATPEQAALQALEDFAHFWAPHYPQISRSWRMHWENPSTFFRYPADIRKAVYTTNAIESLNSVLRNGINKRKVFPSDDSVKKVLWLALQDAAKKWTMPVRDWRMAMSRFIIEFGERVEAHL